MRTFLYRYVAGILLLFFAAPCVASQDLSNRTKVELYNEAQQAIAGGNYDRAIDIYKKLVRADNTSAPLFFQLGVAEYQKGDYPSAASALKKALSLKPNFTAAEAFLGLSEAVMGNAERSIPLLNRSFRSDDPTMEGELKRVVGLRLADLYSKTGSLNEADVVYLALLKQFPDDPEVLFHNFWFRMTRARQIMRKMVEKYQDSYLTHELLGDLLSENQNYAAAAEQYRLALKLNPTAYGLHYELGNMLLALSPDAKAAAQEYDQELRLHPSHVASYSQLAEIAFRDNQLDRAWELYSKALQFDPNYSNALVGLSKISLSRNQPGDALRYCEQAVQADPSNPSAHYVLARAYRTLGREPEAKEQMELFQKLKSEESKEQQYLSNAKAGNAGDR